MKKYYSKTYRFGKVSISIIVDEVILLYRGRNKIYLKKFDLRDLFSPAKRKIYISSLIALMFLVLFLFSGDNGKRNIALSDVEMKNLLLRSKKFL